MSLIRNGGFERGNVDFWTVETGGLLEIDNTNQKYGVYCGKFTSSGDNPEDIISKDYISTIPYQIINTTGYMLSAAHRTVYPIIYMYDADFSYIGMKLGTSRYLYGAYMKFHAQFSLTDECSYIRFGYRIVSSNVDEIFYIDGVIVDVLMPESGMNGIVELFSFDNISSNGDTWIDAKDMKQFSTYYGQLSCTSATGTSPTLNVKVYELDSDGNDILIAIFPQVTASGVKLIDLPYMQGNGMYIQYTVGGSSPVFHVMISVIGKR